MNPNSEISYLKGVGPKRAEAFSKLGITRISDLFNIYPRDYIQHVKIKELFSKKEKNVLIFGNVVERLTARKMNQPTRITLSDGSSTITILLWGNPEYRARQFKLGEKYLFWGKVSFNYHEGMVSFDYRDHKKYEQSDDELLKFPLIPLYILSTELKKTWIRPLTLTKIIFNALKSKGTILNEVLSDSILAENNLMTHQTAVLRTHYPHSFDEIEQARQTLAFEELFFLQMTVALRRRNIEKIEKGIKFEKVETKVNELLNRLLSFELTSAQKRVLIEIFNDMYSPHPMNRLLQGDVGSGKTIVAFASMLLAISNGFQCAFMCPTEILSEQHYKVINEYAQQLSLKCVLLTGSLKKKQHEVILNEIQNGSAEIIVGTHSLIQEKVEFNKLGLVVIDEQHKFGVMQRAKLRQKSSDKGLNPDVLVMTATPIPRTLSLTFYGDLDISVIDELPLNRKSVKTGLRGEEDRMKVYQFIREEISKGRQAYIVYPIIEESEKLDIKSAVTGYENIAGHIFPNLKVALIHGRMPWNEIDETIDAFKNRKIDILVSTTVIEVGIDIPNATIMVIEEAQRFGLSQLHQLRGRVGRGAEQSYCILIADKINEVAKQRLGIMLETSDGFKIAEHDLKLRGPGEFFGIRQSGEFKLTTADLSKDIVLIERARESAGKLVKRDPQLRSKENKNIKEHFLLYYQESMHLINIA